MKTRFVAASLVLAALWAPRPAAAQATDGSDGGPTGDAGGALLPGDVVDVQIWREETLSGQFAVDESGTVVLPLVGARNVMGVSAQDLRDDLTAAYARFLNNPSINVKLLRRITVSGEVRVPGLYTVDATVSIADLIAQSGGLNVDADAEKIALFRDGQRFELDLNGATVVGQAGIRSGDRVSVGQRSWLSRNFPSVVGIVSIISNVALIAISANNN